MAWLEQEKGRYHLCFRYGGKRYKTALKTEDLAAAQAVKGGADKILFQLENGLTGLPDGADLVVFVQSGGDKAALAAPERLMLKQLFKEYLKQLPAGAMELNSLVTVKIHMKHFLRVLGRRFLVLNLNQEMLQGYVNRRLNQRGHRGKLSPTTVKKELTTLSSVWTWAVRTGRLKVPFPRGLRYPKRKEKPPFMTYEEILCQIERGGGPELWECLFLTVKETGELLAYVAEHARHSFICPLFVMAAHTGARRSEILRSLIRDFDFKAGMVTIREKKRAKGLLTTRRVPLSPLLREVMQQWFRDHPGGEHTFSQELRVAHSSKQGSEVVPVTKDEVHDHFRRTLQGSKWEVLRGFHVLRHSFITNAAAKNVDQRMIDQWVGHTTEAMRRRYRHMVPDMAHQALATVFA